jgi:hypothetical protein
MTPKEKESLLDCIKEVRKAAAELENRPKETEQTIYWQRNALERLIIALERSVKTNQTLVEKLP